MSVFQKKEKRLTYQRQEKKTSLHCCVPLCANSSRYNSEISFHRFPVDPEVRARWLTQIRRDSFSPLQSTRVCSRHFSTGDFVVTAVGKRTLHKGAVPCLFAWNDYSTPAPRLNVWERRPRCASPVLAASDTEQEMEVQIAPDHAYSVTPTNENEAQKRKTQELQHQLEASQLAGSDEDIGFYTRFASYKHFQAFWQLAEPAVKTRMVRIASSNAASANSSEPTHLRATGSLPWIVSELYSLQEDSSEEEEQDLISGKGHEEGYGDCVCCVCGETFTFLNNLIQHFNVHKEDVRCHLCHVTFTRAISLALHLENVHSKNPLFCDSCKVKFWNTWHMNQHMRQHFVGKVEPPDEAFKLPPSETRKPLGLDVEEIIIKTEEVEVEVKCVKDEEEEVSLGKMQETRESSITRFTKEYHLRDHNYCRTKSLRESSGSNQAPAYNTLRSTREQKRNRKTINSEPVVLRALPQRVELTKTPRVVLQAACKMVIKGQIEGKKPHETDDGQDNLWECAPIEEDIEAEDGYPMEYPDSETDTASKISSDTSIRLHQSRTVQKRQVYRNPNEKSVNPVKVGAGTELGTSNGTPVSSVKVSAGPESSSSNEKPPNSVKPNATLAKTANSDHLRDHNYCTIKILRESSVSHQAPAYNTCRSIREQKENVKTINSEPAHVFNNRPNTKDSESEGDRDKKVEVVVLRSLPQSEEVTDSCRVVLQAAYETATKTQVPGEKPHEPEEQETTRTSSLSASVSAKVEPVQLELGVKGEDDNEDNLWECAPIEEDMEDEVENEENLDIKEESDSMLDNSLCSPMEEPSSEAEIDVSRDYNSDTPEEGSLRSPCSRTVQKRQICRNANEKSVNPVKASGGPESSSSNSVKASATPAKTAHKKSSITRSTIEVHLRDHSYCSRKSLREPSVSNQEPAYNTRIRNQNENVKNINGEPNTKDSESDGDQKERVEVVALHAKVEPVQLVLCVKVEDDAEDNLWERAPIEEDIEEVKDEDNLDIKEESDSSLDNLFYSPMEEPSSEYDTAYNSDTPEEGSIRNLQSRSVQNRPICTKH